jgi:hypothetical protein
LSRGLGDVYKRQVSTLTFLVKLLLTSTTTKQTWNVLTPFVLALAQEVKGDGFTNMTI